MTLKNSTLFNKLKSTHYINYNVSLIIYFYFFLCGLYYTIFEIKNVDIIKNNFKLLSFIYLFESFLAIIYGQSTMIGWRLYDYYMHHIPVIFLIWMALYQEVNLLLFKNSFRFICFISQNELCFVLINYKITKKYIVISKIYLLYIVLNLIYYELTELYTSYIYYYSLNDNIRFKCLFLMFGPLYHSIEVLPATIKFIKNNRKELI